MKTLLSRLPVLLFGLLSRLPLRVLRGLGRGIGRMMWWSQSGARKVTEENLASCFPNMDRCERQALAKRRLLQFGMMTLEMSYVWRRSAVTVLDRISDIQGTELLQNARTGGKGIIVLAPHIGNWEVIGLYLAQNYPLTSMYQPPNNPHMDLMIQQARRRNGSKLAPTSIGGVKTLLKVLKHGELVGVLPDQVPPRGTGGDFAPFFNIPALTSTLCHNLLRRTGCAVIFAYALREPGGFRLVFKAAPDEVYSEDQHASLTALNTGVEECAREFPEQYQWEYKRFRKQPDGVRRFYRKK